MIFASPDLAGALSREWIEFVYHGGWIAVIFVGRHDAVVAVARLEDNHANHEGVGEVPGAELASTVSLAGPSCQQSRGADVYFCRVCWSRFPAQSRQRPPFF